MIFGSLPFILTIFRFYNNDLTDYNILVSTTVLFLCHLAGYLWLYAHYKGSINSIFNLCVKDLQKLAIKWHTTYFVVNVLIFIVVYLLILVLDIFVIWKVIDF